MAGLIALHAGHSGTWHSARAAEPRPLNAPLPAELTKFIEQGEDAFRVQNYGKVVSVLDRLAGHPLLEARPEHLRVLEMLGASHWFMGSKDSARLVFGQLLRESPFQRLDVFVYPPELIDFFEQRRRELITAGIIPDKPVEETPTGRVLIREIQQNTTPAIVYFVPFGVGQFLNDEDGKGTAMAIVQGLGVATMLASTIAIATLQRDDEGRIIADDGRQARFFESLWYGGAIVFGACWAYSIVDGLAFRDTEPRIEERYELITPSKDVSLRWAPGPGDIGLGLSLDF